jgi:lipopolysaccharide export system permease protein
MRILDAYLLRSILVPLALVFVAFVGIFIIVDLFDRAHAFIDNEVPLDVVLSYYLNYTPLVVVLTAPIAMLLATMLSVGRLSRRNEIMAMKGSGLSLYRILSPILVLAAVLSVGSMIVGETLLPPATRRRLEIEESDIKKRSDQAVRVNVLHIQPDGTVFLARRFDTRRGALEEVTIEEFDKELEPVMRVDARTARWSGDHWVYEDGQVREFSGGSETLTPFSRYETGRAEPSPNDLKVRRLKPEEMGYRELRTYIERLRASGNDPGDLAVQLRLKLAFPFVTLIMALLGAPLAAGARRSGFALSFAAALAISFIYYGLLQVGQVLGRQGMLPPGIAAWSANLVFGALGAAILIRVPK